MSAIKRMAQDLWYSTPGKDRMRARKISDELHRFEQIEKAAQALLKNQTDENRAALKKALKPLKDDV